jgi:hypothetical protein
MPNRILFLVSAVLASLALPLVPNAARAADDCLASPDKATPSGGHWRYHLERGTGRKCWYIAGEATRPDAAKADAAKPDADDSDVTDSTPPKPAMKITPTLERAAASPPERPRVAKPAPPPVAQPPANNARAEFVDPPPPAPAAPAQPDPPQAAAPAPAAQQSTVGTRWPSPGPVGTADSNSSPATSAPATTQIPVPQQAAPPTSTPSASAQPATAASDQIASTTPANRTASPAVATSAGPDYLLYALIIAVTGFTVVAGFAGVRFLADWWRDWRAESRWRRSLQPSIAARGPSMLAMGEVSMELMPAADAAVGRPRTPVVPEQPPRRLEDEIDEVEQLLALTRQAATQPQMSRSNMPWEAHVPRDAAE